MLLSILYDFIIIALLLLLAWQVFYLIYISVTSEKKERYLTEHSIDKLDGAKLKVEKFNVTLYRGVIKLIKYIKNNKAGMENIRPLIYGEPSELDSFFDPCLKPLFNSFRYLADKYINSAYYTVLVFSVTVNTNAKKINDQVKTIRNNIIKRLNDYFIVTGINYEDYVAVKYDKALGELYIFLAKNNEGFKSIENVNNPQQENQVFDLFEESWDDYGK